MKVLVVGGDDKYVNWFKDVEIVEDLKSADLVVFTGGSDVTPILYGEESAHQFTHSSLHRDTIETALFRKAQDAKIPMLGICRGAQFLTVMAGGKLVQHVNGHGRHDGHEIRTSESYIFFITSTHHQMMYPYTSKEYEIIAISEQRLSDVYFRNKVTVYTMPEEPEIVYYPLINALCIQGHPEMMAEREPVIQYLKSLIKNKLNVEV